MQAQAELAAFATPMPVRERRQPRAGGKAGRAVRAGAGPRLPDLRRIGGDRDGDPLLPPARRVAGRARPVEGHQPRCRATTATRSARLPCTGDPAAHALFGPMMVRDAEGPGAIHLPRCRPATRQRAMPPNVPTRWSGLIVAEGADTVLAFIMEPVGGLATGALVAADAYYAAVRDICTRHGILLIHDEVMSGAGRTGRFLASEHWPAGRPDIVVLAKGVSAGYAPLGVVMVPAAMAEDLGGGRRLQRRIHVFRQPARLRGRGGGAGRTGRPELDGQCRGAGRAHAGPAGRDRGRQPHFGRRPGPRPAAGDRTGGGQGREAPDPGGAKRAGTAEGDRVEARPGCCMGGAPPGGSSATG